MNEPSPIFFRMVLGAKGFKLKYPQFFLNL